MGGLQTLVSRSCEEDDQVSAPHLMKHHCFSSRSNIRATLLNQLV